MKNIYEYAKKITLEVKTVSISYFQRKLRIGFNRAANIVSRLEKDGIISSSNGATSYKVLKPKK